MINMDVFIIFVVGGVDFMVLIVGDYFNGNDGIVFKGKNKKLVDIKGQLVQLVEFLVLYYLLVCVLEMVGLCECDVKVVNISDVDIIVVFVILVVISMVIWNLMLFLIVVLFDVLLVYIFKQLFGEIMDLMVVNIKILQENFVFGKVFIGVWYEMMVIMIVKDECVICVLIVMGKVFGIDLVGFQLQLVVIVMFYQFKVVLEFVIKKELLVIMGCIVKFSFDYGIFGFNVKSVDGIGVVFDGNVVIGDKKNVKLCFDLVYMKMVVDGKF